jgi:hypothetical protein
MTSFLANFKPFFTLSLGEKKFVRRNPASHIHKFRGTRRPQTYILKTSRDMTILQRREFHDKMYTMYFGRSDPDFSTLGPAGDLSGEPGGDGVPDSKAEA